MAYQRLGFGSFAVLFCMSLSTATAFAQAASSAARAPSSAVAPDPGVLPTASGWRLSLPIRLSLSGNVTPLAPLFPQCATLEDDVGNSVAGIPVRNYVEWRATPRLTLSAFAQLGCPVDAGIGALLLYAVPLQRSASLVFATGMYGAPAQFDLFGGLSRSFRTGLRGEPSPVASDARVDLQWQGKDGNPYSIGAENVGTSSKRISFSSAF
jgi:hypothetical protein